VLQAKVQLTQAESRRLRSEGALDIAIARIKAVFGPLSGQVDYKMLPVPRKDVLPKTLEEAHLIALQNNKQIQVGMHRSQAIRERMDSTSAREFLPKLNLIAETANRKNTDGINTGGEYWNDKKAMVQFQYSINAGLAGSSAVNSVTNDYRASVSREVESRDLVLEQVNIAWQNMNVSMHNKETLANLVRIAAKYYEMAVAERQMGRRSLLEVLSAELSLINALSDLMATEADSAIASLTLMQAIGKLDIEAFELKPIDSVLPKI
jgi:outer membrane protein TolC